MLSIISTHVQTFVASLYAASPLATNLLFALLVFLAFQLIQLGCLRYQLYKLTKED